MPSYRVFESNVFNLKSSPKKSIRGTLVILNKIISGILRFWIFSDNFYFIACALFLNRQIGKIASPQEKVQIVSGMQNKSTITVERIFRAAYKRNFIFQQDGAAPHWGMGVRAFLDKTFSNRWIGHDDLVIWPPRSRNIIPLDIFFLFHWNFSGLLQRQSLL